MDEKVRWGVLGVANIGMKKVIPAMQRGQSTEVVAIASRDLERARQAAGELGIRKAYGSYEDLLADPEVEAIYNPLPNHLHVPWSIKAAEAGPLHKVLAVVHDKLVSHDFNHDPHSSSFALDQTKVMDGTFLSIMTWYDNEWGFSNRMSDTAVAMGKLI